MTLTPEQALKRYGVHDDGCPAFDLSAYRRDYKIGQCTCGLIAAIEALATTQPPAYDEEGEWSAAHEAAKGNEFPENMLAFVRGWLARSRK